MERWQYIVLFWVAVVGVFFIFFADQIGVELDTLKMTGFGLVISYILTTDHRDWWTKKRKKDDDDGPGSHRKDGES
jgi:hypothetical protein